jgi:hypothetical protein
MIIFSPDLANTILAYMLIVSMDMVQVALCMIQFFIYMVYVLLDIVNAPNTC